MPIYFEKVGFDKGILNMDALMKLGQPILNNNKTVQFVKRPPAKMVSFRIDWNNRKLNFIYNYPIIDYNSFIYETTNLKEFVGENVYKIFPVNLYAIYNSTSNCSRLIGKPSEHNEVNGIYCKNQDFQFKMPSTPFRFVNAQEFSDFEPQIIKKNNEIYIQCYKHNITTLGAITQECPRYPFMVPDEYSYSIEGWVHNYENSKFATGQRSIDIQDIREIEQVYPWSNTFEYIQNKILNMEIDNEYIKKLSNQRDENAGVWLDLRSAMVTLFLKNPILFSCLSLFSFGGIIVIGVLIYLVCGKDDSLFKLAEISLVSSVVNRTEIPEQNHGIPTEEKGPEINISINNQVYPNLEKEVNHYDVPKDIRNTNEADMLLSKVSGMTNEDFQKYINNNQKFMDRTYRNMDTVSYLSLPILEEIQELDE